MAALTPAELSHFDAFGFVVRRSLFSAAEIADTRAAAERYMYESKTSGSGETHMTNPRSRL